MPVEVEEEEEDEYLSKEIRGKKKKGCFRRLLGWDWRIKRFKTGLSSSLKQTAIEIS